MKASDYIVAFHIGRGGRFYNPGYKTFMPHIKTLSDLYVYNNCVISMEDGEGNALPSEEWLLIDNGGNVILEGQDEIESETGVLDWDGAYDTDIVKYLSECSDDELDIIYQAYLNDEYMDYELKDYICESKGLHRIHIVKFYKSNAEIHCNDGTITYMWDGEDNLTEEEITEWLELEKIDPKSIKMYADAFVSHFYEIFCSYIKNESTRGCD